MTDRRTYTKPEIVGVNLIPDEAILADCKTNVIEGPNAGLGVCGTAAGCLVLGS